MCTLKPGDAVILVTNMHNPPRLFGKALGVVKVKSTIYHDGVPSKYALMFGSTGMEFEPGYRIDVEFEVDVMDYCGPPPNFSYGKVVIVETIHEKWLVKTNCLLKSERR